MSGETEKHISGWSVDTLKEYMESRLNDADLRNEQRFIAQEKAVVKAEVATEKRFDGVNEFRAQLSDQAATFMPRKESEARHSSLVEKYDALQARVDRSEGRSGGLNSGWGYLVAAAGLILVLVTIYFALRRG
jgi:hypothetical protein